jgi:hypothetical protein
MSRYAIFGLIGLCAFAIFGQNSIAAEEDPVSSTVLPAIPEDLKYLFDLPWCSRWKFSCMSCEKTGDEVKCFDRRESCNEAFRFHACEIFNPPKGCIAWLDSCNFCGESGCTLNACKEYLDSGKPTFVCRRYQSDK